jgi:hypothetical protein
MPIVASTYTSGPPDDIGRRNITERHEDASGEVFTYGYLADAAFDVDAVLAGRAAAINAELAARALVVEQGVPVSRRISPDAFMSRLSAMEQAKIELASTDAPSAPVEQRLQAAGLRAAVRRLSMVSYVDLDRRDGSSAWALLHGLENAGLLDAAGRAEEIIGADPLPTEMPRL